MSRQYQLLLGAAAAITSAALIVPTSGVGAQSWTTVTTNRLPIVSGSGRIVRQARPVGAFNRVETMGSEDVEVRVGARPSLVISADDNILPLVTSQVRDGTLKIGTRGSFRMRGPIRVLITTPNLEGFTSSGSGNVAIDSVNNQRLALTMNGSGNFRATGRTGRLALNIHGSGTARLAGLSANNAHVGMYGSGDATVRAVGTLDAQVFGSGTIRYVGQPANVRRQRFGSGRIVAAR